MNKNKCLCLLCEIEKNALLILIHIDVFVRASSINGNEKEHNDRSYILSGVAIGGGYRMLCC